MANEFSQQMAEMIAQARPRQAPAGGGRRVMGGGGVMGSLGGTSSDVQAQVQLGPIMRLFGYKTPEEKKEIGEKWVSLRGNYDDEKWAEIISPEPAQKALEAALKAGVPGVVEAGRTSLGRAKYDVAKPKVEVEAKKLYGEPTGEKARAGFFGPQRREEAIAAEERVQKAGMPLSVTQVLTEGGEKAQTYITNQIVLKEREAKAAETELDRKVKLGQLGSYEAQRELFKVQRAHEAKKTEVEYSAEAIKIDRDRKTSETNYYNKKAVEADASAKYHISLVGKTTSKENLEMFKLNTQIYKQGQSAFINVVTGIKPGEKEAAINQLTAITSSHIYGTQDSLGKTEPANDAMSFWLDSVMPEVAITVPKKGLIFAGPGPEMELRLQKYARNTKDLVKSMGLGLDVNLARKALNLMTEVCEKTTLTQSTAELAKWAIDYFNVPQLVKADPTFREDLERLRVLITPRTTGGITETPLAPAVLGEEATFGGAQ